MPYFTITDFAAGLDLRRSSLTAPAGTLRALTNCHVTPGGEIEKRFNFEWIKQVDPSTKGLIEVNQLVYVFGTDGPGQIDPTGPFDVGTLQLDISQLDEVVDHDLFTNKAFVITRDLDGTLNYFYDGAIVPKPVGVPTDTNYKPGAQGLYCRTYRTKMYTVQGTTMYYSAVGDPTDWGGTGAGFTDLSLEDSDMSDCIALEVYYNQLAIFSETACQLWTMNNDPLQNQFTQTLRQAGTIAWRSVLGYGSGDVMYVAPDGVRSLRARNASLAAAVSDIGSPLDPVMQGLFRTQGKEWMSKIISMLQPVTGRFWIFLPDRIFVLSAFPGPKITAWSEYTPTDANGNPFNIVAVCTAAQRVYVRDDQDNIYVFGGTDPTQATYDDCPVEIVFPFHAGSADVQATFKRFHGIDAACEGEWDVYASYDPTTEAEDYIGKLIGPTFLQGRIPMEGHGTHISLRLRSTVPGPLTLSNMIVHYDSAEQG
jgi:hypothetical protein